MTHHNKKNHKHLIEFYNFPHNEEENERKKFSEFKKIKVSSK